MNDTVDIEKYAIGGQMITVAMSIQYLAAITDNHVKQELAVKLAYAMIENKLIEFTRQEDPYTDEIKFRARAYVAPDTQVRILRTIK